MKPGAELTGSPDVALGAWTSRSPRSLRGLLLVLGWPELRSSRLLWMRTALAERGLRGCYCPVCVIVAPEGIYVGRVCPPGPVGSMLLVWTVQIMASGAARRGALASVRRPGAGGRSGLYERGGLYADARPDHESVVARGQRWEVFLVASDDRATTDRGRTTGTVGSELRKTQ